MGVAFFIVLDNKNPGFDTHVNGHALAREGRRIERFAKKHGIKSPLDFCSISPDERAKFIESETDEEVDEPLPPEEWWTAAEGLAWVAQFRSLVEADPTGLKDPQGVLRDLDEVASVLTKADRINARWHYLVDF